MGAFLSHTLIYRLFGISAYLILYLLYLGLEYLVSKKYLYQQSFSYNSCACYIPVFIFHFYENSLLSGGLGINTQNLCKNALGEIGTTLLLITVLFIYIPLTLNIKFHEFIQLFKAIGSKINRFISKFKKSKEIKVEKIEIEETEKTEIEEIEKTEIEEKETPAIIKTDETNNLETNVDNEEDNLSIKINESDNEEKLSEEEINQKLKELGDYDPTLELSSYKMPGIDLLNDYGDSEIKIDKEDLEDKKNKIVETLGHYKIGISSISATVGPTITLYEIVPEAGVRISKIKNLEDDIALSLSAEGIRIIAPIPGKGTIGIEVPNKTKNTVSMLEVLSSEKFQNNDMALPIAFGKTISNETYLIDLAKMPHLLMAGATGQGKSVGLNAVLASLLYKKHPSQVKFVLIDPKKVELTLYNKIERHYLAKLTDQEEAILQIQKSC